MQMQYQSGNAKLQWQLKFTQSHEYLYLRRGYYTWEQTWVLVYLERCSEGEVHHIVWRQNMLPEMIPVVYWKGILNKYKVAFFLTEYFPITVFSLLSKCSIDSTIKIQQNRRNYAILTYVFSKPSAILYTTLRTTSSSIKNQNIKANPYDPNKQAP